MFKKLAVTFFGSGYLPIAPGTWGSLAAGIVFVALAGIFSSHSTNELWLTMGILTAAAAGVGIALGKWAVEYYGRKDPKPFVLDEVAGQWLAFVGIPFSGTPWLLLVVIVQFVLFRIFDIIKPPPAREAESLPHGWGIVTDDLFAGLFANLCGQVLFRWLMPMH